MAGAAAGFSPAEVDRMSLWQLGAATLGVAKANGAKIRDEWTADEEDEVLAWLDGTGGGDG